MVLGFFALVGESYSVNGYLVVGLAIAAIAALFASVERARNRLTRGGTVGLGLASVGVMIVSVITFANVSKGGGYVIAAGLSCVALLIAASDAIDRWRYRPGR